MVHMTHLDRRLVGLVPAPLRPVVARRPDRERQVGAGDCPAATAASFHPPHRLRAALLEIRRSGGGGAPCSRISCAEGFTRSLAVGLRTLSRTAAAQHRSPTVCLLYSHIRSLCLPFSEDLAAPGRLEDDAAEGGEQHGHALVQLLALRAAVRDEDLRAEGRNLVLARAPVQPPCKASGE